MEWEREATILQGCFGQQEIACAKPLGTGDGVRLIHEADLNFAVDA